MLPIFISNGTDILVILKIIGVKFVIGMTAGFIIDYILRNKKTENKNDINTMCEHEHCDCEHGILKSACKHTLNIFLFIIIISFVLNAAIDFIGEDILQSLFTKNIFLGPILTGIIGLIPNCAASVVITQLYLEQAITLGTLIAGTSVGSGVGIAVLFKVNKNIKQNLKITALLYGIGVFAGIIINLIGI